MYSLKLVQAAALGFLALVHSQALINPDTISLQIRKTWCVNQKAACPLLCTQISDNSGTASNTCDPATLAFTCVCDNGNVPNATEFSQTIPFYECQESNNQCAGNCDSGDNACITGCRTNNPCGAKDPTRHNVTSTDSSATATKTKGASATASASGSGAKATGETAASTGFFGAPAATSSSAASSNVMASTITFRWAETYGLAVVFASLFAGFAILL